MGTPTRAVQVEHPQRCWATCLPPPKTYKYGVYRGFQKANPTQRGVHSECPPAGGWENQTQAKFSAIELPMGTQLLTGLLQANPPQACVHSELPSAWGFTNTTLDRDGFGLFMSRERRINESRTGTRFRVIRLMRGSEPSDRLDNCSGARFRTNCTTTHEGTIHRQCCKTLFMIRSARAGVREFGLFVLCPCLFVCLFVCLSARLGSIRVIVWCLIAAFCYLRQGWL
jgi:hypothetical protein